jgi:formylmethanofuran:tetrahydromethanopterin formyltransferase
VSWRRLVKVGTYQMWCVVALTSIGFTSGLAAGFVWSFCATSQSGMWATTLVRACIDVPGMVALTVLGVLVGSCVMFWLLRSYRLVRRG